MKRRCTDCLCYLIFVAFVGGMFVAAVYGWAKGDVWKLLSSWESESKRLLLKMWHAGTILEMATTTSTSRSTRTLRVHPGPQATMVTLSVLKPAQLGHLTLVLIAPRVLGLIAQSPMLTLPASVWGVFIFSVWTLLYS